MSAFYGDLVIIKIRNKIQRGFSFGTTTQEQSQLIATAQIMKVTIA